MTTVCFRFLLWSLLFIFEDVENLQSVRWIRPLHRTLEAKFRSTFNRVQHLSKETVQYTQTPPHVQTDTFTCLGNLPKLQQCVIDYILHGPFIHT